MERELLDNIDHSVQTRPSSPTPEVAAPLPGLLALQRLAGNRAVSAMIARRTAEPAAEESAATTEPDTSLQRLATRTGLKTAHAQKVLYNHLKGDPPFKPQRGNFGQVSWFAGSGNPYVGGQAQSYDVTVDVVVDTPVIAVVDGKYGFGQTVTPQAVRIGIEKCWTYIDAHLAQHGPHLLGAQHALVDFYALMLMRWSRNMPRPATSWPAIAALATRLKARPSWPRVNAAEGLTEWP